MNTITLLVLTITGQPITATPRAEYRPHEPIELRADLAVPDGYAVAQITWDVPAPARGRSYESSNVYAVWAPPGSYDVEMRALLIDWEKRQFQQIDRVFTVAVQGAQPPPGPDPPAPPTPPDPTVGPVSIVIVRDQATITPEQTTVLLELRAAAIFQARGPPDLWILDIDTKDENNQRPAILEQYLQRIPTGSKLPYYFAVAVDGSNAAADGSNAAAVIDHGELPAAADKLIEIVEAANPKSEIRNPRK